MYTDPLCYFKFLKFLEEHKCVFQKNKISYQAITIIFNNGEYSFSVSINKDFDYFALEMYLKPLKKLKFFDLGEIRDYALKKKTDMCKVDKYRSTFDKIVFHSHC